MKVLNWIILACTFIGAVGAEAAKDRAKLKTGRAEARRNGLKPGMVGGTAFNEAVLPALQGMGGD